MEIKRKLKPRTVIETLDKRRRNNRVTAGVTSEGDQIIDGLLATEALGRRFERIIDRQPFQKIQRRCPFFEGHTGQLTNAYARVRQRSDLRTGDEVKAVLVVILVDINLGSLLRRNRLLDAVGKYLTVGQIRSHVHVGGGDEAVGKIVNAFDIKTRATLIRMLRIRLGAQHSILDDKKTGVEKRT